MSKVKISSIKKDVHRLHVNTTLFDIKGIKNTRNFILKVRS